MGKLLYTMVTIFAGAGKLSFIILEHLFSGLFLLGYP